MNRLACISMGLTVMLGALAVCSSRGNAQPARTQPPKHSFSNGEKSAAPKPSSAARRQATQEELVDTVLGDTMNRLWEQTDSHFHEGEYNHCVNLNRIVVQGDPHNMEAFASSSWLLWSTGRNDEALAMLIDGIAANPNTYYMYDETGRHWLIQRKDPKSAIPYFEKAIKFDCPWVTWNSLAVCYEKLDQWDKAVSAWEKAAFYPDDKVAGRRLKQARDRLAQQKGDQ